MEREKFKVLDHTDGGDPAGGEEWHGGSGYDDTDDDEYSSCSEDPGQHDDEDSDDFYADASDGSDGSDGTHDSDGSDCSNGDTDADSDGSDDDETDTDDATSESTSADEMEESDEGDVEMGQTEPPPVHTLPEEFFAGIPDGGIDFTCLEETVNMLDPAHVKVMLARAQARMKDLDDVAVCLCCDRLVLAREVCTYPLNRRVPRHLQKLNYNPRRLKLGPGLRQMYKLPIAQASGMVAADHDNEVGWQRLIASPRAVNASDQSVAICKPCNGGLKRKKKRNGHHWLPQFAIKNGYFMGVGADVPELAELTVLEAMLLSSCGPTYSAIRTFYVKYLPNAAEAGELFGRGLLIGHHCVKQFAPADIAAFVKSIDDAGTLQYDSNKAPLPLNVHVVMPHGELRNQAAVLDAIAKCKRVVTCRPAKFATAVRWLKEHNAKCEQLASPVTLAPAHVHAPAPRQPAPSGGTSAAKSAAVLAVAHVRREWVFMNITPHITIRNKPWTVWGF